MDEFIEQSPMAQYGLQGSITQIGVVTSGVPTSIQRQILATHKEPPQLSAM
jgi:hypothetical protein